LNDKLVYFFLQFSRRISIEINCRMRPAASLRAEIAEKQEFLA